MTKINKKGFTLIELLIVIVIIGILAVAVLSAINPIEQRNKATDTALRSDAAEMLNAIERYYTSKGYYPWTPTGAIVPGPGLGSVPAATGELIIPTAGGTNAWLGVVSSGTPDPRSLIGSDELKAEFGDRESLEEMYISVDTNDLVKICYEVSSNQFTSDDTLMRTQNGTPDTSGIYRCVPE